MEKNKKQIKGAITIGALKTDKQGDFFIGKDEEGKTHKIYFTIKREAAH